MTQGAAKTGLIVVDLQQAFDPPDALVSGIRAIRDTYDIVIVTQFLNRPYSVFETKLHYRDCQVGSTGADIVVPLRPSGVFDRYSYGLQQVHIDRLKEYDVPVWDICGCDADACVLATCYNLWDNGIRFRVLKELCHSSGGETLKQAAFTIMQRSFGE